MMYKGFKVSRNVESGKVVVSWCDEITFCTLDEAMAFIDKERNARCAACGVPQCDCPCGTDYE